MVKCVSVKDNFNERLVQFAVSVHRAAEDYLEAMLMMKEQHGYVRSIAVSYTHLHDSSGVPMIACSIIGREDPVFAVSSGTKTTADKSDNRPTLLTDRYSAYIISDNVPFVQKAARNFHGKTEKVFWENGLFIAQMNKL